MAIVYLRKIPDELKRRLKSKAAENGVTLEDECLAIIEKHCGVCDERKQSDGLQGGNSGRVEDGRKSTSVPVLRSGQGPKNRLRPVRPVRDKLAGRGEPGQRPENRAQGSVYGEHESHRLTTSQGRGFCITCNCEIA